MLWTMARTQSNRGPSTRPLHIEGFKRSCRRRNHVGRVHRFIQITIRGDGSWRVAMTHIQDKYWNRLKKSSNIPRSKIMIRQTFAYVRRTMLDRQHFANWQTVTGRCDSSRTVTSLATRYGSDIGEKIGSISTALSCLVPGSGLPSPRRDGWTRERQTMSVT